MFCLMDQCLKLSSVNKLSVGSVHKLAHMLHLPDQQELDGGNELWREGVGITHGVSLAVGPHPSSSHNI